MTKKNLFGKNLRYLRLRDNITQDELASELDYKSFTTIQKWEAGITEPNMTILNKLADKWNLSLDDLVNVDLEAKRYDSPPTNTTIIQTLSDDRKQKQQSNSLTVYGKVCAGDGFEAFDDPIDEITNPYHRIKREFFALQVHGDSMNNIVKDGMYAIIEKKETVNNGEIAVVLIDNEVGMLKRFYQLDESTVVLKPDSTNPTHKAMIFENEEINRLKILGRYIGHVSPMLDLK